MTVAPADLAGHPGTVDGRTLLEDLRAAGLGAGLAAVGVTTAEVLEPARTVLHERKAQGLHGSMQFTYRNPDRSTDPARVLQGARSVVVAAYAYDRAEPSDVPAGLSGRVARYAWRDHYQQLGVGLEAIAQALRRHGWQARTVADDNALVDRAAAWRAGLGWYGKNANVLLPGSGSWFVLGAVVTDAVLPPAVEPVSDGCGGCTRCLEGCPTSAIVAPGVVDARRCLAWVVQAPGVIPPEYREAIGDRLYGCDDCQEVCPPNRAEARRNPPDEAEPDAMSRVELRWLLEADDADVMGALGRWYIPRRDPDALRRNALVVLGNTGDPQDEWVRATVGRYLTHPNPLLRAHATWAGRRLGLVRRAPPDEGDPLVLDEWRRQVGVRGPAH